MKETVKRDPANFRAMQEPYESIDAANEAWTAFVAGVAELRKKYRIASVYTIAKLSALDEDGEEGVSLVRSHLGSAMEAELMCAWALGQEQKLRENIVARALKGNREDD